MWKLRSYIGEKAKQNIARNNVKCSNFFFFTFYGIIAIEHGFFKCISIRQVPWEVLKTAASSLGFQQLLQDLASVNA